MKIDNIEVLTLRIGSKYYYPVSNQLPKDMKKMNRCSLCDIGFWGCHSECYRINAKDETTVYFKRIKNTI